MGSSLTTFRRQTTLVTDPSKVERKYYVVDADGVPLGRLAVVIGQILMGKHRPEYTPHVDTGEHVIVINGTKVAMTGRKGEQNLKLRYSRYPGGLKANTYNQVRDAKPELLIGDAVRRMLPKNRLARVMMKKLHVTREAGVPAEFASKNPVPINFL